jgi:N4-gp56 family major capsid protein
VAKKRQADWWQRVFDELLFMYASGARGVNADFVFPSDYTGFANNAFSAPDADHLLGVKATIANTNKMSLNYIDVAKANAEMMGGGIQGTPQIQPIKINGEDHYVCVMNPWQEYDLRTATGESGWLSIQKAAATAEGKNSPIFKGGLGMHNNVVLHSHKSVVRFSDYGAGSPGTQPAARALFLGDQALVMAFGSPGTGLRFDWNEETRDNGNQVVISTNSIFGINKTTFNGKDYGVIAIDTYAAAPTA